uniref:Putative benzenetriol oxygenase n=1 Tax=Burkholderia cepacia TaxID=292 RepID=Q8VUD1_BURCE|nr:putative benzenetriol oxygenase [Burkholderia cepacia]
MRNVNQSNITEAVLERLSSTPNPRLKQIMTSLVQHLHAFARDAHLTEDEWMSGIEFLTRVGHITDDKRQEFILLSDVLGLSMLTVVMNNDKPAGCTEATVFGPFYVEESPQFENGDDVGNGAAGKPCNVTGSIRGLDGKAIVGATIEVWQSDSEGYYDVQMPELKGAQGRGTLFSGPGGKFEFRSVLAEAYPIPHDGPVGDLLKATAMHPWRPAHLHFRIQAEGYETLVTHIFRLGDKWLDSDAVFAVRETLIVPWVQTASGDYAVNYDFVLNPANSK